MVKHLNCQFTKPQTMKKFLHLNFHTQLCQLSCQSFAIVEILQKMEGCSMGQKKNYYSLEQIGLGRGLRSSGVLPVAWDFDVQYRTRHLKNKGAIVQ